MIILFRTTLVHVESDSELDKVEYHHAHRFLVSKALIYVLCHIEVEPKGCGDNHSSLLQARAEQTSIA